MKAGDRQELHGSGKLLSKSGEPALVLASASARRRDLLETIGLEFSVCPSDMDESSSQNDPLKLVYELATGKARHVALSMQSKAAESGLLVLGADTVVVLNERILGKPASHEEAREMLLQLSGNMHTVITGLCLISLPSKSEDFVFERTRVFFRPLSLAEASYYANSSEPMDKAGAYALQGAASAFIEKVEGCFTNVIGLPLSACVRLLRKHGMTVMGEKA